MSSGELEIGGRTATSLAAEFGTPLWVISDEVVRANISDLRSAFERRYPSVRVVYASKANPEPAILRICRDEGLGLDVVTAGHMRLAEMAGFPPHDLVLNGNSKTMAELSYAVEHGVGLINVDSAPELEMIAAIAEAQQRVAQIGFRLALDPAGYAEHSPELAEQLLESKFGMSHADIVDLAARAVRSPWLRIDAILSHLGFTAYGGVAYSREAELDRRRIQVRQTMAVMADLLERFGIAIPILDLGGGFRRGRSEGYGPASVRSFAAIDDVAAVVVEEIQRAAAQIGSALPTLLLEAGGYIVSDAVTFLASVGFTKQIRHGDAVRTWVFLENTSAYHFVRRLMHGFHHHALVAARPNATPAGHVSIAGATCAEDSLATDIPFPAVDRGDVVAFLDQGAYCEAVTSDYCAIPIPATVLVRDGRAEIVRPRRGIEEMVAQYALPSSVSADQVRAGGA